MIDFLEEAKSIAKTARCKRRQVGAVLELANKHVYSEACGAVVGDCCQNDCMRCNKPELGLRSDLCICSHAEEKVILRALSSGEKLVNSVLYVSLQPCIPCTRLCILAGVSKIIFAEPVVFPSPFENEWKKLMKAAGIRWELHCGQD